MECYLWMDCFNGEYIGPLVYTLSVSWRSTRFEIILVAPKTFGIRVWHKVSQHRKERNRDIRLHLNRKILVDIHVHRRRIHKLSKIPIKIMKRNLLAQATFCVVSVHFEERISVCRVCAINDIELPEINWNGGCDQYLMNSEFGDTVIFIEYQRRVNCRSHCHGNIRFCVWPR